MPWTAPEITRPPSPLDDPSTDERTTLLSTLEWNRATFLWKCSGLTGEALARRALPPSGLSLLGIARHLADAERAWFRRHFRGEPVAELHYRPTEPDAAFTGAVARHAEADHRALLAEQGACRAAIEGAALSDRCAGPGWTGLTLHGVLVHMVEEYGRHNGHADLLRERIDGTTGE